MADKQSTIYRFGGFQLDAAERLLYDADRSIQLPPKAFDTLQLLVENAGRVLSKERMLAEIWEGSFVEENNLAQNISLLRKTLGENKAEKFIETVPKFGYRFIAEVATEEPGVEVFEGTRARVYVEDGDGIHHISQDPSGRAAVHDREAARKAHRQRQLASFYRHSSS